MSKFSEQVEEKSGVKKIRPQLAMARSGDRRLSRGLDRLRLLFLAAREHARRFSQKCLSSKGHSDVRRVVVPALRRAEGTVRLRLRARELRLNVASRVNPIAKMSSVNSQAFTIFPRGNSGTDQEKEGTLPLSELSQRTGCKLP